MNIDTEIVREESHSIRREVVSQTMRVLTDHRHGVTVYATLRHSRGHVLADVPQFIIDAALQITAAADLADFDIIRIMVEPS